MSDWILIRLRLTGCRGMSQDENQEKLRKCACCGHMLIIRHVTCPCPDKKRTNKISSVGLADARGTFYRPTAQELLRKIITSPTLNHRWRLDKVSLILFQPRRKDQLFRTL